MKKLLSFFLLLFIDALILSFLGGIIALFDLMLMHIFVGVPFVRLWLSSIVFFTGFVLLSATFWFCGRVTISLILSKYAKKEQTETFKAIQALMKKGDKSAV